MRSMEELTRKRNQVVPGIEPITDDVLDFDKVWENYKKVMTYVAKLYVDTVISFILCMINTHMKPASLLFMIQT